MADGGLWVVVDSNGVRQFCQHSCYFSCKSQNQVQDEKERQTGAAAHDVKEKFMNAFYNCVNSSIHHFLSLCSCWNPREFFLSKS